MRTEDFGMWAVDRPSIARTRRLPTLFPTPERGQATQKLRLSVLWRAGRERQRPPTLREHRPFAAKLETDRIPRSSPPPTGKSANTLFVHQRNRKVMFLCRRTRYHVTLEIASDFYRDCGIKICSRSFVKATVRALKDLPLHNQICP